MTPASWNHTSIGGDESLSYPIVSLMNKVTSDNDESGGCTKDDGFNEGHGLYKISGLTLYEIQNSFSVLDTIIA